MFSHYIQLFGRLMLVAQDNMVALFKQLGQVDPLWCGTVVPSCSSCCLS